MTSALTAIDPVLTLNQKAKLNGWTFSCDRDLEFDAPQLKTALALWREKSGIGRLPSRADFSARDLLRVLPVMMISDVVLTDGKTRFRYRYVGTQIAQTIGEMTGKFIDEVLPEPSRERTIACCQTIIDAREPLRFLTKFSLDRISYLSAEFLGVPLASDGVTVDMIMTITDFRSSH